MTSEPKEKGTIRGGSETMQLKFSLENGHQQKVPILSYPHSPHLSFKSTIDFQSCRMCGNASFIPGIAGIEATVPVANR